VSTVSDNILNEFSDKEFRDGYVEARSVNMIAYQLRALREQRNLSQKQAAHRLPRGTQSSISRAEDPDYGKLAVSTLLDFAAAYDVALVVKFCSHEEFLLQTSNLSPLNLQVQSYDEARVNERVKEHQKQTSPIIFPMVFPTTSSQKSGFFQFNSVSPKIAFSPDIKVFG
jgi:transcriptional regulator with XRE-family HTH domain